MLWQASRAMHSQAFTLFLWHHQVYVPCVETTACLTFHHMFAFGKHPIKSSLLLSRIMHELRNKIREFLLMNQNHYYCWKRQVGVFNLESGSLRLHSWVPQGLTQVGPPTALVMACSWKRVRPKAEIETKLNMPGDSILNLQTIITSSPHMCTEYGNREDLRCASENSVDIETGKCKIYFSFKEYMLFQISFDH